MRLVQPEKAKDDPDPKALSCYGLLRADTGGMLLRCVSWRPVSQVAEEFLAWVCARLAAEGKKALLMIWDNASWHVRQRVRTASQESVVERHRAEVAAWQESDR